MTLCGSVLVSGSPQGSEGRTRLWSCTLLLPEQAVKMMNLKDKHGSEDVKQGTKKPFLPYRSFPLQFQRETNSLSFYENQMKSRSLLTEKVRQTENWFIWPAHTPCLWYAHAASIFRSDLLARSSQKKLELPLLQTLCKLWLSPRPAIWKANIEEGKRELEELEVNWKNRLAWDSLW